MNSSLQGLHDSMSQYTPGALYSAVDRMGYQLDDNLNQAREQLVEMIQEIMIKNKDVLGMHEEDKEFMQISIKLLFHLGIIRSNVEDYLTVISLLTLLSEQKDKYDFIDLSD